MYLEDYFEVLPTDDEETADIKRKLISKMKMKRQMSMQLLQQSQDDQVEEPQSPTSPFSATVAQMTHDVDGDADADGRGRASTDGANESKQTLFFLL